MQATNASPQRQRCWAARVRTGCATCRQRRVKCDEHKPACHRCFIAQRKCHGLGYGNQPPPGSASCISPRPSASPRHSATSDVADIIYLAPLVFSNPVRHDVDPTSSEYVPSYMVSQGKEILTYIDYLPSACGHSDVLDGSMRCVADAMRIQCIKASHGQSPASSIVSHQKYNSMRASYSKTLKKLQRALDDPEQCVATETLCAAILLYTFEVGQLS